MLKLIPTKNTSNRIPARKGNPKSMSSPFVHKKNLIGLSI
jgi:hypothetical protein